MVKNNVRFTVLPTGDFAKRPRFLARFCWVFCRMSTFHGTICCNKSRDTVPEDSVPTNQRAFLKGERAWHTIRTSGEVNSKSDLKKIFTEIRQDVDKAKSRPDLTSCTSARLLVTLTHSRPGREVRQRITHFAKEAMEDLPTTARKINRQAKRSETEAGLRRIMGSLE